MRIGVALLLLLTCACSTKQQTEHDYKGARYTIVCRNEMQDCYDRARELCPHGYLVANRVRGIKIDDKITEYSVIIRCKDEFKP